MMKHIVKLLGASTLLLAGAMAAQAAATDGPSDAEIAHIAYTAGQIDIAAARQALAKSKSPEVRSFAQVMLRDHQAVEAKALGLVKKLGVTPTDNGTSQALAKQAAETSQRLASLDGAAFDRAYIQNEAAYHQAVNGALKSTLIPSADNEELKALLQTGLTLFGEHQAHAEQLASRVK
jgi:putative membrane protein